MRTIIALALVLAPSALMADYPVVVPKWSDLCECQLTGNTVRGKAERTCLPTALGQSLKFNCPLVIPK